MTKMNKRSALAIVVAVALLVVAAVVARPILGRYYWQWRSGVQALPYAGGTVSYRDLGSGAPVVVIVNGMAVTMDSYYGLQKSLSSEARVIAFDRPGIARSTPNAEPRTLPYIDKDMKAVLQALKAPPPYILVGHSLGGHIIRYYADRHPGEVAGLVYLDAPHEDWPRYIRETWSPEEVETYFKWWSPENEDFEGVPQEEMLAYETNCDLIRGVLNPPDVPALMFTGNNSGHFRKTSPGKELDRKHWEETQASMLAGVHDKRQLVDWSVGHMMYKDKPEWVASEIKTFIRKVRDSRGIRPNQAEHQSPAGAP